MESPFYVREIRLELTRLLQHYLLRVARLPISPLALEDWTAKLQKISESANFRNKNEKDSVTSHPIMARVLYSHESFFAT